MSDALKSSLFFRRVIVASATMLLVLSDVGCRDTDRTPSTTDSGASVEPRQESFRTKYKALLRSGNHAAAERLIVTELTSRAGDAEVLLKAARLSVARQRFNEADERFTAAIDQLRADGASSEADAVLIESMTMRCVGGDVMKAIESLTELPTRSENATRLLTQLLNVVGDTDGADRYYVELLLAGTVHCGECYQLACEVRRPNRQPELIQAARRKYPDDWRPEVSTAVDMYEANHEDQAIEVLTNVVARHPDYTPAVGWLAFLLADNERLDEMQTMLAATPQSNWTCPNLWYGWGLLQMRKENYEEASSAFAKAVSDQPVNHLFSSKLAVSVARIDAPVLAAMAERHAKLTQQLRIACRSFGLDREGSQAKSVALARVLLEMGHTDEAHRWLRMAEELTHEVVDDRDKTFAAIRKRCHAERGTDQILLDTLSKRFDLSRRRPSGIQTSQDSSTEIAGDTNPSIFIETAPVVFKDEASERGIDFVYDHGEPDNELGRWIYQTTGGGIAVADFDRDGWQDIYFTQAGGHPNDDDRDQSGLPSDQLVWNHAGRFQASPVVASPIATSLESGSRESGYGQGVAAGDLNGDGFPDLMIANFGKNQLLINRGDGTFADVTDHAGIENNDWSSSVAIVDVNADGHCDLLEINYCDAREAADKACHDDAGEIAVCVPVMFSGSTNRLWISGGDGTFSTDGAWQGEDSIGRGLGVLVADLDEDPGVEVFVANDMSSNHFWKRHDDGTWRNEALIRGVAVGFNGRPQACMGIAWADLDRDQNLDFVVSNFSVESNALYMQTQPGFFTDRSAATNMTELSFPMLGFGLALGDFNQDGREDLFVANGRVTRNSGDGEPFKQPAQVMNWLRESGNGTWRDAQPSGDYFDNPHTGRAVAIADLDNDSRADLIVGHLGEPTSVLMGRSQLGRQYSIDLIGTTSSRDAVGATVTLTTSEGPRTMQVAGGHGYFVTHQPTLRFGLADGEIVQQVRIDWPSGQTQLLKPRADLSHVAQVAVEGDTAWTLATGL